MQKKLLYIQLFTSTYHLALHCFELFLCSSEAILAHWFFPYFITAAFNISSWRHIIPIVNMSNKLYASLLLLLFFLTSVFLQTPPFIIIRGMVAL